ncbi:MAG: hypothetical protein K8T20_09330 [Planctomycetes bacterium]|nr:hypothetical protein [Planctomycetota bacterium]
MKSLAVVALAMFSGCGYIRDRARDAGDIFHLDVSLGPQIGGSLRLTHLAQAGLQFEGGKTGEGAEDREFETGHIAINGRWSGIYKRRGSERGIGPESIEPHLYQRAYTAEYEEEYRDQPRTADEFGFSIAFFLVGVEMGFRPVEAIDFITGFFGVDILKDDNRPAVSEDTETWMKDEKQHDGSEEDGVWRPRPKPYTPTK